MATVGGAEASFCCYGCVLALQVTRARGEGGVAAAIYVRLGLAIFFAMNVMMLSLPTYAPYVYGSEALAADGALFQVLKVLALAFAAPVLLLLGWPILIGGLRGLRGGWPNTDALIVLGTTAAYALSVFNTVIGDGPVYFDTAAMLLVLITVGRYLEARAKAEAGAAVRARLAPQPAAAARVIGERSESIDPAELCRGDSVRVSAGEIFPTDGVVSEGVGGVDESALTGEGRPVLKRPGDPVAGGTCSIDGLFVVHVTAPQAESAVARIAAQLDDARRQPAAVERLADRVAGILLPLVVAVSLGAGAMWWRWAGPGEAILVALAVLVVACPCGLGIATPVAVWSGLVTAARRGVIVRSAPALERAAGIHQVLLDKTGTLTEATPRLVAVEVAPGVGLARAELLARAVALEEGLTHPIARAIAAAQPQQSGPRASAVRVVPGLGVRGLVDGEEIAVGSREFARGEGGIQNTEPRAQNPDMGHEDSSSSVLSGLGSGFAPFERSDDIEVLAWRPGRLLGTMRFAEAPRPEAAAALSALRRLGVVVGLLSGAASAGAVVPGLLAPGEAALGLSPEQKLAYVRARRAVAMVGDGINDAPALAAADLGIAVGSATDLARMTADVAIVGDDLGRVPWLIAHARRVARVIRQNLFWVFAYNGVAVALAAAGRLNPLVASFAMLASSLVVIANARRLHRPNGADYPTPL